jgi:hypothetical protein
MRGLRTCVIDLECMINGHQWFLLDSRRNPTHMVEIQDLKNGASKTVNLRGLSRRAIYSGYRRLRCRTPSRPYLRVSASVPPNCLPTSQTRDQATSFLDSTSEFTDRVGLLGSVWSYLSTGRPKHSTYPLLSTISKALSPSLVFASSRCTGTSLPTNSVYSESGSSVAM